MRSEVGKHGIYIKRDGIPVFFCLRWRRIMVDRLTFLSTRVRGRAPHECLEEKNTEIYIFSADIF